MVESKIRNHPEIRLFKRESSESVSNFVNAFRKCRGDFIIYLADDDALIFESIPQYVRAMQSDSKIAGIFADWIAYDDESEKELHRYYYLNNPVRFEPGQNNALVEFMFSKFILPEIGIYRRDNILNSMCTTNRIYPNLLFVYHLATTGSIIFTGHPFYKENRVIKKSLSRNGNWLNMSWALGMIGDEMRDALENLLSLNMTDSAIVKYDEHQVDRIRSMIDRWLHSRIELEITRAIQRNEFIIAVQLRRRLQLWYGLRSENDQLADLYNITIPAAFQHVNQLYTNLSEIENLVFHGFKDQGLITKFNSTYPNVKVSIHSDSLQIDPAKSLLICWGSNSATQFKQTFEDLPGHVVDFSHTVNFYRISTPRIIL
jgi:hypothetical protein